MYSIFWRPNGDNVTQTPTHAWAIQRRRIRQIAVFQDAGIFAILNYSWVNDFIPTQKWGLLTIGCAKNTHRPFSTVAQNVMNKCCVGGGKMHCQSDVYQHSPVKELSLTYRTCQNWINGVRAGKPFLILPLFKPVFLLLSARRTEVSTRDRNRIYFTRDRNVTRTSPVAIWSIDSGE